MGFGIDLRSGKHLHNYGKSPVFFHGKSHLFVGISNSYVSHYQRYIGCQDLSFSSAMASPFLRLFQPLLLLLLLWPPCSVPRSGVLRTGGLLAAPAATVKPRNEA